MSWQREAVWREKMKFININLLGDKAEQKGFKVRRWQGNIEVYNPDHVYKNNGFYYGHSDCDYNISDSCDTGYGYNSWFYGPFHPGLTRSTCPHVLRLLAHPLMGE